MSNFKHLWFDTKYVERYNTLYKITQQNITKYLTWLELSANDILIDFGCGNGTFLKAAAPKVKKAIGIDYAPDQLQAFGSHTAIELICASFLDLDYSSLSFLSENTSAKFTKAFAKASLHHLTDAEKVIFFNKIKNQFAPGAYFLIADVIFNFKHEELEARKGALMVEAALYYGDDWAFKRNDVLDTWFKEYPADIYTWKKILEDAGFQIIKEEHPTSFLCTLLAKKSV